MEALIDKLIGEIQSASEATQAEGGFADLLPIASIYFGDPGVIPASLYPCITVEPDWSGPLAGTTGYDTRELRVIMSVHIDAREWFDSNSDEAMGDRILVQVVEILHRWFQTRANRTLDGTVRNVEVTEIEFLARDRQTVIAKTARMTLVVTKNYSRVLD